MPELLSFYYHQLNIQHKGLFRKEQHWKQQHFGANIFHSFCFPDIYIMLLKRTGYLWYSIVVTLYLSQMLEWQTIKAKVLLVYSICWPTFGKLWSKPIFASIWNFGIDFQWRVKGSQHKRINMDKINKHKLSKMHIWMYSNTSNWSSVMYWIITYLL